MKVTSAVLIGVNVAASLSVAAHPALAQDGKALPTADFLKSALVKGAPAALDATPAKSLAVYNNVSARKVSMSEPRSVATRKALATTSPGVKLRAFVPNRTLPSAGGSLVSETAVMDYSNQAPALDGGVSEYSTYYADEAAMGPRGKYAVKQQQRRAQTSRVGGAAKVASSYARQTTPRAVPGGSPAIPGQVGLPCAEPGFSVPPPVIGMRKSAPRLPHVNELPSMQPRMQPPAQMPQAFAQAPAVMQDEPVSHPPRLSPQEQLEMNKLVENACIQQGINPTAVGSNASPDLYSRVGAPPFPLSLIPEPMMKDFLKGARAKKSAIAGSNLAMGSGGGVGMGGGIGGPGHSNPLPTAGFRSYLHGAQSTSAVGQVNFQRISTAMPIAKHNPHPAVKPQPHHVAPKKAAVQPMSVQNHEAPKQQQIMTYPPYRSQVNFGS
ncbi:MAG: hypothetical protein SGJ27_19690 [Candidatus Melainabacteria bacterium]|nr:hypothetical protein [Candidatus Melainabacteria bacterium]